MKSVHASREEFFASIEHRRVKNKPSDVTPPSVEHKKLDEQQQLNKAIEVVQETIAEVRSKIVAVSAGDSGWVAADSLEYLAAKETLLAKPQFLFKVLVRYLLMIEEYQKNSGADRATAGDARPPFGTE
jgi:hypothetical protein